MADKTAEAAAAARREKTPPEFYEADTVHDMADVAERYSPEFLANNEARGKRIAAIMAAARQHSGTLKYVATSNGYRAINKRLAGTLTKNIAKADATILELDRIFADPLAKLERDAVVWRGLSKGFAADLDKSEGGLFTDSGFMLVSVVERPLAYIAKIELKAGTPVVYMGPHLATAALLKRGTTYRVISVIDYPISRVYRVRMEE